MLDILLHVLQKAPRVRAVHLRVMELERHGERRFQKAAVVSAPDDERVIEYPAVHPDRAVKLRVDDG